SSELNRIELIVSELLVLAKPQATTYRQKDVTRLLLEVVTLIDTQAIMSNIQVVTHFADDLPWINCDDNQMKQVFINFLKNAIEAMHAGGEIRIEANRLEERQVLLRFIDEGCGISEDLIARIGEPFYTTKDKGTGLGMMVSKTIIENHGGQMRITSQVGVGTTIELVMPGVEQDK
ncbi:MAG: ATP-binding protein, partial [Tumebacillaceae bacterium]